MKIWAAGFLFFLASFGAQAQVQSGRPPSCGMFQATFIRETGDVNAAFVRPLVVSATTTKFEQVQNAAIRAALGWNATRASTAVRTMSREAEDYLRASNQRGDVFIAGKTEYHEGGADMGMIWTMRDRTLIIVGAGG